MYNWKFLLKGNFKDDEKEFTWIDEDNTSISITPMLILQLQLTIRKERNIKRTQSIAAEGA